MPKLAEGGPIYDLAALSRISAEEAGWGAEPVWTTCREENLALAGTRTPIPLPSSP
jgi:hypothetical protein